MSIKDVNLNLIIPGALIQFEGRADYLRGHKAGDPGWDPLMYVYRVIEPQSTSAGEQIFCQELFGDKKLVLIPLEEFATPVDKEKYPNATQKMRYDRFRMLNR